MRILFIEDDPVLADIVIDYLEESYTIDHAFDTDEAQALIDNQKYELFIFDVNIPFKNGIEFLRDLRSFNILTPAIMLTAYDDTAHIKSSFDAGAHDYIRKPFELEELKVRIERSVVLFRIDKSSSYIVADDIIYYPLKRLVINRGVEYTLRPKDGEILVSDIELKKGYFSKDGYNIFISDTTKEHLGIMYVITQSNSLKSELVTLQRNIFIIFIVIFIFIAIIALILSKIFMRPIAQKVKEIESFINDVTHELNTPITALSISSNRAIKESYCSPKTIKNISISTKQLYDIYRSLTYLNFSSTRDKPTTIDISQILKESISYYQPLCDSKYIKLDIDIEEYMFDISISRLQLLYGNLIGNAIKYSTARSDITIRLKDGVFSIKDNGIGIEESRQKDIFKKFQRCTTYSGGFGVGLYIVKSICDEYNIDIKLNSKPMEGSKFMIDFRDNRDL